MNRTQLPFKVRTTSWAVLGLMVAGLCAAPLRAEETKTDAPAKVPVKKTEKKLTGAQLYAINCNRCHAERYPTEFTASQWETIMLEMRVRANLPAKQAKEILKYLKEDAGGN